MAGVVPKKLSELTTDINNALITALILTKSEPRIFLSKDQHDFRGVISYTLRDSKCHLVNCKCWGTREQVDHYHRLLKIYDIVDVISPKIMPALCCTNQLNPQELEQATRFQPLSTLPYALVLSDSQGRLDKHDYRNMDSFRELRNLARVPHKPLGSVLNLADAQGSTGGHQAKEAHFVDLLVVVRALKPIKKMHSARSGELLRCLELIVFDCSCEDGMILTIWHGDWIQRAEQYWEPLKTILHLIDVKVCYSEFYKSSILSFSPRTLVYENPIGREVDLLAQFAATAPLKEQHLLTVGGEGALPEAHQITQHMTIQQIYSRAEGHWSDDSDHFTAVLYAMVTKFDLDGQSFITSKRCKSCFRLLPNQQTFCDSNPCQLAFSLDDSAPKYEFFFNINIHFSDHTGTLTESRLIGTEAERLLAHNVDSFNQLTSACKEHLKWRYLMSHVEVKLLIKKQTPVRRNLTLIVVDMRVIQLNELAANISVF